MDDKKQRLDAAVHLLRQQFGSAVIRPLRELRAEHPHVSSSFTALDAALAIGGFPCGHLSHLSGLSTSGSTTIALKTLAHAVGVVAYVDLTSTFDADYATRCGVDVNSLLLLTPTTIKQALESIAPLLSTTTALTLILPRDGRTIGQREMTRFTAHIRQSHCAVLVVEHKPSVSVASHASVQLTLQRSKWLYRREDVSGYRTSVTITRNQFGQTGVTVDLVIGFSATGDGA
jgi:hypothetical protein